MYKKFMIGKTSGKRPHNRHTCRWKDAIKRDVREVSCEDVGWI
jgi:hypothetical protein